MGVLWCTHPLVPVFDEEWWMERRLNLRLKTLQMDKRSVGERWIRSLASGALPIVERIHRDAQEAASLGLLGYAKRVGLRDLVGRDYSKALTRAPAREGPIKPLDWLLYEERSGRLDASLAKR